MNTSEQINELFSALSKAQAEFKIAGKSSKNPFFKSSYADFESIVGACRESLAKHGLAFVQVPVSTETGLKLTTRICHSSGQWLESDYPINPIKNDPQGLGSAMTYAKRYALQATLGIVAANEDDDGEKAMGRDSDGDKEKVKNAVIDDGKKTTSKKQLNNAADKVVTDLDQARQDLKKIVEQKKIAWPQVEKLAQVFGKDASALNFNELKQLTQKIESMQ